MRLLRTLVLSSTLFTNWFASSPALSDSHVGTVLTLLLNSEIPGRGLCVQMSPSIQDVSPPIQNVLGNWGCLHKDNALYHEISALLFTAYATGVECAITWDVLDNRGHAKILWLQCTTELLPPDFSIAPEPEVAPGAEKPEPVPLE
jgi:hypothetical protein